jgi:spore coat protein CotH
MVEHPDDFWAQRMLPDSDAEPALYKAIVAARFRYVGDDPALYVKVFNQQAESRSIGPKPMIDFLKFVERSSDSDFEARLADHLDVAGFASYLAYQNLLVDPDSFAGTGNNYYFLYDVDRDRLEIAAWDQNLALGRLGLVSATYHPYYEDGSGIPSGLANLPGFEELVQGEGGGEPNLLATRFLGSPKFRAMYDRAYRGLYERLFISGRIQKLINRYVEVLRPANLKRGFVDPDRFEADVQRDLTFVAERQAYLSGVPPIAG